MWPTVSPPDPASREMQMTGAVAEPLMAPLSHIAVSAVNHEFGVAAEFFAHGGEEFVGVVGLAAAGEALIQGAREHRYGDAFVDGREHRPAALTAVGDEAAEVLQIG